VVQKEAARGAESPIRPGMEIARSINAEAALPAPLRDDPAALLVWTTR